MVTVDGPSKAGGAVVIVAGVGSVLDITAVVAPVATIWDGPDTRDPDLGVESVDEPSGVSKRAVEAVAGKSGRPD